MALRPVSALWFELLVVRNDLTRALAVLAKSGSVELQSHSAPQESGFVGEAQASLQAFEQLRQLYGHYWPAPRSDTRAETREPAAMLAAAMRRVQDWVNEAGGLVAELQHEEEARQQLILLEGLLASPAEALPDLELVRTAGPMLVSALYLLPGRTWPEVLPASVITQSLASGERRFLLALGTPEDMADLDQQLAADKARRIVIPEWLSAGTAGARDETRRHLQEITEHVAALRTRIDRVSAQQDMAAALADIALLAWYVEQVPEMPGTDNFAWITGWTSARSGDALLALLAEHGIRGLLRTSVPPADIEPPSLLRNPAWLRPFEFFSGLLGVPRAGEADPTAVVAVVGPLMFGYMFGDVGHGLVLMLAGAAFSRRLPALRLLIPGGAVSIIFGLLYGSVFAREDLIPALWLHPLAHPVAILAWPLAGGAILLLLGMLLEALQQAWQRHLGNWMLTGAALVLCYAALLGSVIDPRFLWVALAAALWFISGHAIIAAEHRLSATGAAATELAETVLQLLVNTISFVRVGAFALAHAGLSAAVVGVAEAPANAAASWLLLIAGNMLIIALEGLIVGIQTTRLVLFEFFIRFLGTGGRRFRPLTLPGSTPGGSGR